MAQMTTYELEQSQSLERQHRYRNVGFQGAVQVEGVTADDPNGRGDRARRRIIADGLEPQRAGYRIDGLSVRPGVENDLQCGAVLAIFRGIDRADPHTVAQDHHAVGGKPARSGKEQPAAQVADVGIDDQDRLRVPGGSAASASRRTGFRR